MTMILNYKILSTALSQYNQTEIKGGRHNSKIIEYFAKAGFPGIKTDEVAWCAAFANWVLHENGLEKSGKVSARSLLKVGHEVKEPMPGDLVVFWRHSPKSWKGHVGFYIGESERHIHVLGGNQGNKVCISSYSKHRLLGYRRLKLSDGIIKPCKCDKLPIDKSLMSGGVCFGEGARLTVRAVFVGEFSTEEYSAFISKIEKQVAEQLRMPIKVENYRIAEDSTTLEQLAYAGGMKEIKDFYGKYSGLTENITIFVLNSSSKLEGFTKHYVNSVFVSRESQSEYSSTIAHQFAHLLGLSDTASLTEQEKLDFGIKGDLEKFNLMNSSIYGKALSSRQLSYLHNFTMKHHNFS